MKLKRIKYKDIEETPQIKVNKSFKSHFFGSSPAPFIGRYGYPNINVGVLSPQYSGDTSYFNSPKQWSKDILSTGQIANMRFGLVNSRTKWHIKDLAQRKRFIDIVQESGVVASSVELEVDLKNVPVGGYKAEKEVTLFGPRAEVKKARVTANSRVDTRVDRVISDTDLKAVKGVMRLYKHGFEESFLNKALSVGTLGVGKNRKLVPTRWSITAVDDTVGKELIKEIKDMQCGEYAAYFGGEWGNYYLFLFFPDVWSYELFEMYLKKPKEANPWSKQGLFYSTDYESYEGRKKYAEETAGGYYASRLPVLEEMKKQKRQGSCLALRFITDEYQIPLGVWICRESSRKSVGSKRIVFASQELMLEYARRLVSDKFAFDLDLLLGRSKLLQNRKQQVKLSSFF